MAKQTATSTSEPRVRFNWGFWDGFGGSWKGGRNSGGVRLENHFDRAYAAGALAGEAARRAGEQPDSSDGAWAASAA